MTFAGTAVAGMVSGYGGGMTETGQAPEPSNADLLQFMQTAFAHLTTQIAGVKDDVAHTEARLTSRISDVQQVVQSLKADLAAHVADGHDGRDHPRAA